MSAWHTYVYFYTYSIHYLQQQILIYICKLILLTDILTSLSLITSLIRLADSYGQRLIDVNYLP